MGRNSATYGRAATSFAARHRYCIWWLSRSTDIGPSPISIIYRLIDTLAVERECDGSSRGRNCRIMQLNPYAYTSSESDRMSGGLGRRGRGCTHMYYPMYSILYLRTYVCICIYPTYVYLSIIYLSTYTYVRTYVCMYTRLLAARMYACIYALD